MSYIERSINPENRESRVEPEDSAENESWLEDFEKSKVAFREILSGCDYSLFASTAMALNGQKFDLRDLIRNPGDFDINAGSAKDFDRILERIGNYIKLNQGSESQGLGSLSLSRSSLDGARMAHGYIPIGDKLVEFEVYDRSSLVPSAKRFITEIAGLNVLNLEGLQDQYRRNIEIEKRINEAVDGIEVILREEFQEALDIFFENENMSENDIIEIFEKARVKTNSGRELSLKGLLEMLDISLSDLRKWLEDQDSGDGSQSSRILAGIKTKITSRRRDLKKIEGHLRPSIKK